MGVKNDQRDHAGPEDRHGMAEQAEHAHQMILPAVFIDGGINAHGNAEAGADQDREGRQLHRRRHDPDDVFDDRTPGADRGSEIAGEHVSQIIEELLPQRTVETERVIDLFIGFARRILAHDRPHGIGGHQAADKKGQQQQSKQRNRNTSDLAGQAI